MLILSIVSFLINHFALRFCYRNLQQITLKIYEVLWKDNFRRTQNPDMEFERHTNELVKKCLKLCIGNT